MIGEKSLAEWGKLAGIGLAAALVLAAVGEGIGSNVEDAHDNGHPRVEFVG